MGVSCSREASMNAVLAFHAETSDETGVRTSLSSPSSLLEMLSDDMILHILSFVSYAPFEVWIKGNASTDDHACEVNEATLLINHYNRRTQQLLRKKKWWKKINRNHRPIDINRVTETRRYGSLTHILPLVNKRFWTLCHSEPRLWTEAITRNVGACAHWKNGLLDFLGSMTTEQMENNACHLEARTALVTRSPRDSVNAAYKIMVVSNEKGHHCFNSHDYPVGRELYRKVQARKTDQLPIFIMNLGTVALGDSFNLRLFEPRYCLMIREAMAGRSERERSGDAIASPRPRFLWAFPGDSDIRIHEPGGLMKGAAIVEVRFCRIRPDGLAFVIVVPVAWVLLTEVTMRPDSGRLFYGTFPSRSSQLRLDQQQRLPVFAIGSQDAFLTLATQRNARLRLFEARYKRLAKNLVQGRSQEELNGGPMALPRPRFIFAADLRESKAKIAEVLQCTVEQNGEVILVIAPLSWVFIEGVEVRPGSGGLHDATFIEA